MITAQPLGPEPAQEAPGAGAVGLCGEITWSFDGL